jgi:hypothetical protein
MKSPEVCFLEIITSIQVNFEEGRNKIDNNENIFTNSINFSKNLEYKTRYLCNSKSKTLDYTFKGDIRMDNKFNMHYYFSNLRSYISIDTTIDLEQEIPRMQLNTFKYTELLYKYYNIDEFIYNLINENN